MCGMRVLECLLGGELSQRAASPNQTVTQIINVTFSPRIWGGGYTGWLTLTNTEMANGCESEGAQGNLSCVSHQL